MTSIATRSHLRLWDRVVAWVFRTDNARTDFTILAAFHGAIGLVLILVPALAKSPSLDVLISLASRQFWAAAFLATFVLGMAGLRVSNDRWAGRLRHYSWICAGTNIAMWVAGIVLATGSVIGVLTLVTLMAWHTLTAARLELPRALDPHRRR